MLSLADATAQPLGFEAELRRDPTEGEGCLVVRAEPGEGIVPIGLPGSGSDGIEQCAFEHGRHQATAGAVRRPSHDMLARKEGVRLEERRSGVADGV